MQTVHASKLSSDWQAGTRYITSGGVSYNSAITVQLFLHQTLLQPSLACKQSMLESSLLTGMPEHDITSGGVSYN
jgi:hypothetical protein